MKKQVPYHLEVEIDRLTNSVQNTISGDSFATDVLEITKADLKTVVKANGKKKLYTGVPGNLFASTCKLSWDKGYEGFVSFQSKTKLIEHYELSLGATHVGGHKMVIFPVAALKLIKQYFKT